MPFFMSESEKQERARKKQIEKEKKLEARRKEQESKESLKRERAEQRRLQQERERKRRDEEAFRRTPKGMARTAKEKGDTIFRFVEELSTTIGKTEAMVGAFTHGIQTEGAIDSSSVEDIESEGWTLINDNYIFQVTGSVSRDKFLSSGQQEAVSGQLIGIYTFRAVDE